MAKGGAKILFGLCFFVVLVAGLAGGGAWYLTEHRTQGYRATALLRLDSGAVPATGAAELDPMRTRIQEALGLESAAAAPELAVPDYAVLFRSDGMAKQLQERLAAGGSAPMSLEAVRAAMDAEITVALQTSSNVVYQRVIQLHFTADDPALAATAAQAWADLCIAEDQKQRAARREEIQTALRGELDPLAAQLEAARDELAALQKDSPLESLELTVTATGEAVEALKVAVREAQAEAARGDASLKALKAYVAKAPPAVVLELSMAEATAEAETAGARAQSEFLSAQMAAADTAAADARMAWAEASRNHERVEAMVDRLAPRVEVLERQLLNVQASGAGVQLASAAVAPETPIGPHRYVLVAGAAILGAIAGMIVYFGLLTLRVYARELDRS